MSRYVVLTGLEPFEPHAVKPTELRTRSLECGVIVGPPPLAVQHGAQATRR